MFPFLGPAVNGEGIVHKFSANLGTVRLSETYPLVGEPIAWWSTGYTTENDLVSRRKRTTSGMPRRILYLLKQRRLRSKTTRFGSAILPYLTFQPKYTMLFFYPHIAVHVPVCWEKAEELEFSLLHVPYSVLVQWLFIEFSNVFCLSINLSNTRTYMTVAKIFGNYQSTYRKIRH